MFQPLSLFELCLRTDTVHGFYRSHPKNNSTISSSVWEAIDLYIPKNIPSVFDDNYCHWWDSLGLSTKSKRLEFTANNKLEFAMASFEDRDKILEIWRETIEKLLPKTGDEFYFGEENVKITRAGRRYDISACEDAHRGDFCYNDIIIFDFHDLEKIDTSVAFCLSCRCHFFTARYDKWGNLHNQNGKLALNLAAGEGHAEGGCNWDYWHGNLILHDEPFTFGKEYMAYQVADWFGYSAVRCLKLYK